jgi:hypothetical protein
MRREHEVERIDIEQMDGGPTRQRHQQAKQAANGKKDDGGDGIGFDQPLGREIDFKAGGGASPELGGKTLNVR